MGLSLLLTVAIAWARGFTPHQAKTMDALIRQCRGGVGKACYDYGRNLELFLGRKKHRERVGYVRRACRMAYAPACAEVSSPQPLKFRQASRPKSKVSAGDAFRR